MVTLRLLDGFADVGESREVDRHLRAGLAQGGADRGLIAHVGAEKPHPLRHGLGMSVGKVVQDADRMPGSQRLPDTMTADVAGTAYHKHVHDSQITPAEGLRQAR